MATQHFATLRQSIPRMRQLLSQIEPTFRFETVADIDAAFLSAYRHVWHGTDTHTREAVRSILSKGGTQIRKPSGELVQYGMKVLGELDPQAVLMVGDQYLTDIASANLAGARSAKVRTFRQDTFPVSIRLSQHLENAIYRAFG
ncbi:MAG: hypothetical protein AMS18_14765 [Gemmatimonas sp. SG8_17]|nr:MAG: hypothetical protein AMS18_14765 [Gemmatimonas sp. SG8_17]